MFMRRIYNTPRLTSLYVFQRISQCLRARHR